MPDYTQAMVDTSHTVGVISGEPGGDEGVLETAPRGPEVLLFRHEGALFAIPVASVDAIIGWRAPVEVPAGASGLAGLVQHEGRVVAVAHGVGRHADPRGRVPSRIIVCPTRYGLVGLPATSTVGVTSLAVGVVVKGAPTVETDDGVAVVVEPDSVAAGLAGVFDARDVPVR